MVTAVLVVLVARFAATPEAAGLGLDSPPPVGSASPVAVGGGPSATAIPPASSSPSPSPLVSSVPTTAPSPSPSPVPSSAAPTVAPSFATYTVRSGDTLASIAGRFGTTARAIAQLNGIDDPRRLRIGQVLRIPPSAP
jgi:LysM repeat protein